MNQQITEAIIILAIGMITVFVILGLVVLTGQLLIRITNQYATQEKETPKGIGVIAPTPNNTITESKTNKKKLAAIIGAVELITQGRGRIEKIEKI